MPSGSLNAHGRRHTADLPAMEMHQQQGRLRPRIGWIMAGLALVPLGGLIFFAVQQVRSVSHDRAETLSIVRSTDRSVALVNLGAAVADEKHWTYALDALADLGIDPASLVPIVGIDVVAEHEHAITDVDAWLDALASPGIRDQILHVRSDATLGANERTLAFEPIEEELEHQLRLEIDELLRTAAALPQSDQLIDAARVLDAAAAVRSDIASQLGSFFGTRFTVSRSSQESVRLLAERFERYRTDMAQLTRLAPEGSRVHEVIPAVTEHPDVERFIANTDDQIDRALRGEVEGGALDMGAQLEDPDEIAETFTVAVSATDAHLPLVNAAADDITQQAADIRTEADLQLAYAASFWAIVTLVSIAGALAATRVLVRPLRRMSDAAAALRTGSLDVTVDERGPREIQTAARAINEAIEQLKLVERQATALAEGAVEDPVLEAEAPGRLGSSLRRAVSHLTDSLTEREEFRRRLAHEASHDGLTGLANRRAAIEHLSQALARTSRTESTVAVLFVDLDGFKAVNDLHGHPVGDRVLAEIAHRLDATIRDGDLAGRLGGDEFIVVAEPVADDADALSLANRLTDALSRPLTSAGITITPHCSIGVALPNRADTNAEQLVHDADLAVYEAKRRGRSEIVVCSDDLRRQVAERGAVERGLTAAIEHDHLELYFQTIIDARTCLPTALEALVRWHHPDGSLVPPDTFIPVAERSDLILDMDLWVLDRAARHLATWDQRSALSDLTLAVNLSSRHLARADLAERVLSPLRAHGVDPARLVIEVTESALLDDLESAATQLRELRASGVRIAIDDFGTGYTSLTHLRSLPVDILKIDRSYTWNLDANDGADATLVRLIIDAGHLLGLEITAEGVESHDQVAALTELGADTLQGFHFSRPVPADRLLDMLEPNATLAAPSR